MSFWRVNPATSCTSDQLNSKVIQLSPCSNAGSGRSKLSSSYKGITHDTLDSEKFIVFRASQIACVESGETMRESLITKICRSKRSHSSSPQTERGKRLLIQFRNINAFLSSTLQPQASWKSNTLVWVAAFFPTLCLLICDEHSTLWSQFCISTNNVYIIFCCRKVTSRNNP